MLCHVTQRGSGWAVMDDSDDPIDTFTSERSARHYARMLDQETAIVQWGRPIGCRIQPRNPAPFTLS